MPSFKVKVKWGKEIFSDVELNTDEEPMVFKAQLFALTGVEPHRQKVMLKGGINIKDDEVWGSNASKIRDNATVLLMGSKEEDIPSVPKQNIKFIEDLEASELSAIVNLPVGLTNLGNTCYLNATIQCLKTVPELVSALNSFSGSIGVEDNAGSITAAFRDLIHIMDGASEAVPPIILLQVLHMAFPRFAEKSSHGGYVQQDANECWIELLGMLEQKLPAVNSNASSIIQQYFGGQFETETKCLESQDEAPTISKESFLQYSCYIDKDVRYLNAGLKNRLREELTKFSSTLNKDSLYVKTLSVSRLPGYLTIQMVRFQFKQKEGLNAKVLKDVKFPFLLDAYELCSPDLQNKLSPMRRKFKDYDESRLGALTEEQEDQRKIETKDKYTEDTEPYYFQDDVGSSNSGLYELQAILTHKGRSSNSGHYVAWIQDEKNKEQVEDSWIIINDGDVHSVHKDDILKLSGGGDWHTAYILLYGPRRLPKGFLSKEKGKMETE